MIENRKTTTVPNGPAEPQTASIVTKCQRQRKSVPNRSPPYRWEVRTEPGGHVFLVEGELEGHGFENQHVGKPFRSRQHWLGKLCKTAEVEPFGFHAIRHLSAVMLYHAGYSVATIQAMLRHENAGTTEIYLKRLGLDPGKLRDAIEDVFSKKGSGKVIEFKPSKDQKNAPEVGTSEAF
jgi:integrase